MKLDPFLSTEVVRASPVAGVGGAHIFGLPLSEGVLILTAIYTVWLIIRIIPSALETWMSFLEKRRDRRKQ